MLIAPRTLLTHRADLAALQWLDALPDGGLPPPWGALPTGSVLVKVEAVALTANTFTYGPLGEQLGYWDFFPTARAAPGTGCTCCASTALGTLSTPTARFSRAAAPPTRATCSACTTWSVEAYGPLPP
ncbi:MAG TPA: DUF2855 family protein [Mycobacteriales bacterium]|nr:DUF2855 family protein [Mycobacteriales bacterium]